MTIAKVYRHEDMESAFIEECSCSGCAKIRNAGKSGIFNIQGPGDPYWSYGCVKCGCKRCPHRSDHRNKCTSSNELGQPGSDYE
jgi:hypothetical protein